MWLRSDLLSITINHTDCTNLQDIMLGTPVLHYPYMRVEGEDQPAMHSACQYRTLDGDVIIRGFRWECTDSENIVAF
jgi:hypothetical protein